MSAVTGNSPNDYQFYNVDQVFDYLQSIDMSPVVELSFMPSRFVDCGPGKAKTCQYAFNDHGGYKGLTMPPDNFNDWYSLINALGQHLVGRYGLKEVSTWNFEVWNEMWGVAFPDPYMQLFNASSKALKAVDSSLRVGGPATMQTQFVPEFIGNATEVCVLSRLERSRKNVFFFFFSHLLVFARYSLCVLLTIPVL